MGRKSLKSIRQKEIIKTFYKVAKKEGLEHASIAKTAAAMDINPSLVLHYFASKEQLIFGLIEYILDKYMKIFNVDTKKDIDPIVKLVKVINNVFSRKWNVLFDDDVSYSCYSLTFRDQKIKNNFKTVLDALRKKLEDLIIVCNENSNLAVKDPHLTADLIFILADGAYYYLNLVKDKSEYQEKLQVYKQRAFELLNLTDYVSKEQPVHK